MTILTQAVRAGAFYFSLAAICNAQEVTMMWAGGTGLRQALENRVCIFHYAIILTFLAEKDEPGSQNSVAAHSENGSEPPLLLSTAIPQG